MPDKTLDSALQLALIGWKVFPVHGVQADGACTCGCADKTCINRGKHPVIAGWQNAASSDADVLRSWWEEWPLANIGVATGANNLVIVDIDPRNGGDESWLDLLHDHGVASPATITCLTGGGGQHLYFRQPETGQVTSSVGRLGPGLDVKGGGGFVVAPTSVHASGQEYAWEDSHGPFDIEPMDLPQWLQAAMKAQEPLNESEVAGAAEGQRNSELFRRASSWRGRNLSRQEAERKAIQFADNCNPPLPRDEAKRLVANVYQRYQPETSGVPRTGFDLKLVPAHHLNIKSPATWVVENVLPAGEIAVLFGQPGTGKSFLAGDVAFHVSLGLDWFGHETTKGPVVYLAGEGRRGWQHRVAAWKAKYGQDPVDTFFPESGALHFRDPAWVEGFLDYLKAENLCPVLVVIDTLSSAIGVADENASDAMNAFVEGCKLVCEATGACVLVVHHPAKAQSADSPRGHGTLGGSASTVLRLVDDDRSGLRKLTCEKQRDGEAFDAISFRLKPVTDSCVVDFVAVPTAAGHAAPNQTDIAMAAIARAASAAAEGVTHGQLIAAAEAAGVSTSTAGRALSKLEASGAIRKDGQLYFPGEGCSLVA